MTETNDLTASNEYIEAELKTRLKDIENSINSDVIVSIHPIVEPFDSFIRDFIEDIEDRRDNLLVILETEGGSIETAERISNVFRYHYRAGEVSFLVPNYAMSAGTILVMSGDNIYMDYFPFLAQLIHRSEVAMVPLCLGLVISKNIVS